MKIFFAISIDTEIDRSKDWKVSENETFFSVLDGIPQKLTPLFNQFGAKPTYFLSSEVIENNDCIFTLKNLKNCELGTHLHGDLVEPQRKFYKLADTYNLAMQNSYPKETEYQKLKNLTDLFIEKLGYQSRSFRAGRFAAGENTVSSLERLGYLVDSSITPGIDWNYPEGRANFLYAKDQPYFPSFDNLLKSGSSKVLEVPLTIFNPFVRKICSNLKMPIFQRIANRLLPQYWLRPSFQTTEEMIFAIMKMIGKYQKNDSVVLNMMFHSIEVISGASPYNKTKKEAEDFLEKIKQVLEYCKENKFNFVTLSELYNYYNV